MGVLGLAGLAASVAGALELGLLRLQNPPLSRYPIQGLDVSHHQKAIDWERVAADGRFRFVWIKATEGGDFRDSRFAENWEGRRRQASSQGRTTSSRCAPRRPSKRTLPLGVAAYASADLAPRHRPGARR